MPRTTAWTVPADHPAFAGHFPGRPLLPGVALLSAVQAAASADAVLAARFAAGATLAQAKFLAPVAPGTLLTFALDDDAAGLRFAARAGDVVVARGAWQWTAAEKATEAAP